MNRLGVCLGLFAKGLPLGFCGSLLFCGPGGRRTGSSSGAGRLRDRTGGILFSWMSLFFAGDGGCFGAETRRLNAASA